MRLMPHALCVDKAYIDQHQHHTHGCPQGDTSRLQQRGRGSDGPSSGVRVAVRDCPQRKHMVFRGAAVLAEIMRVSERQWCLSRVLQRLALASRLHERCPRWEADRNRVQGRVSMGCCTASLPSTHALSKPLSACASLVAIFSFITGAAGLLGGGSGVCGGPAQGTGQGLPLALLRLDCPWPSNDRPVYYAGPEVHDDSMGQGSLLGRCTWRMHMQPGGGDCT